MAITLCADDFGTCDQIDEGITDLANKKILNAISCMTNGNTFLKNAKNIKNFNNLGLHLNLTNALYSLMVGNFNISSVMDKFRDQLDIFCMAFNKFPDFVDGHKHIHVFPKIRSVFFEFIETFPKYPFVRNIYPCLKPKPFLKSTILRSLSIGFKEILITKKILHNDIFGGLYSLSPKENFEELFLSWSKYDGALIMCHPGKFFNPKTNLEKARNNEYWYLKNSNNLA